MKTHRRLGAAGATNGIGLSLACDRLRPDSAGGSANTSIQPAVTIGAQSGARTLIQQLDDTGGHATTTA